MCSLCVERFTGKLLIFLTFEDWFVLYSAPMGHKAKQMWERGGEGESHTGVPISLLFFFFISKDFLLLSDLKLK